MLIPKKGFWERLACFHKIRRFEAPADKRRNPFGFTPLGDDDDDIIVCVKCGKRFRKWVREYE